MNLKITALVAVIVLTCGGKAWAQSYDEYATADSAAVGVDFAAMIEQWCEAATDDKVYADALETFRNVECDDYEDYMWCAGVLYYGFTALDEYQYIDYYNGETSDINDLYAGEEYRQAYDKAIELLKDFPANIKLTTCALNCTEHLDVDAATVGNLLARYDMLLELIYLSCDGTKESPFVIIDEEDAYNFLYNYFEADEITDITDVETDDPITVKRYTYTLDGESYEACFDSTFYDATLFWDWLDDEDSGDESSDNNEDSDDEEDSDYDGDYLWPFLFLL